EPINPSTHQPINPSTHQPINPSTHQPINPSTHQPVADPSTMVVCGPQAGVDQAQVGTHKKFQFFLKHPVHVCRSWTLFPMNNGLFFSLMIVRQQSRAISN
ncbi:MULTISPECIES: hypothetical protein, partial [Comamonas]|uniref:hypothetical protein n=1 Tax=Comamonas TaxID=283 RepID=UPI00237D6AB3